MIPNHRLGFGIFMAPFHRVGENPTLALRRDIELIEWLDQLGFDEAWVGEHHSNGWELIASPEMVLAAAGERTQRIRLGTGVVSVPYHHPLHLADRIILLDHLTRGRAMLGVGPGQLPADAHFLGIEPNRQREMMDEGLGIIIRLMTEEEPITYKSDWFELNDAHLQLKPVQRPTMPMAAAASYSPAGLTTAGKHGIGVLSVANFSAPGMASLPTQWGIVEQAAREAGKPPPDRRNWRLMMPIYIAETREQAIRDVEDGLLYWNRHFWNGTFGVLPDVPVDSGRQLIDGMNAVGAIIGSPEDAIERIAMLQETSGGFGCLLGMMHEWTTREKILHSYELLARYVMPQVQDSVSWTKRSNEWTKEHRDSLIANTRGAIIKATVDYAASHPDAGIVIPGATPPPATEPPKR